ncbi:MAG: hypothetical protein ACODAG_12620 [Myxococcota bacterium]
MTTDARPLIDTDATGFFATGGDDLVIYWVCWNRSHTARYARAVLHSPGRLHLDYRGQAPLRALTTADALPVAQALRQFATRAPYTSCVFCHRPLEDDLPQTFGMGIDCACNRLGVTRRFLRVLFDRTPPTGPGTPVVERGHLRLVAVNGELVAA